MPLNQLEAFDPPATRRLIVHGPSWWCGVDPSTQRCSMAMVGPDGEREVHTVSFPTRDAGARRLAAVYDGVCELARSMLKVHMAVVAVEQASGRQPNPALSYAVGVTIAAIAGTDGYGSTLITTVPSSTWKKVACGHGGIRKPALTDQTPYGVLTWAQSTGYTGSSWDEADAWGIAEYARKTYALEQRLTTTEGAEDGDSNRRPPRAGS